MSTAGPAPLLVFGWGNLSRGDDALGPLCINHLRAAFAHDARVEFLDDYQLQVEHALDLVGRERVLFIDASVAAQAPFEALPVAPAQDASYSTHAMSPQALLHVYTQLQGTPPPPCTQLAIRADHFGLGEAPTPQALAHLGHAQAWAAQWIAHA
jgi:hydrogenase maturation protease